MPDLREALFLVVGQNHVSILLREAAEAAIEAAVPEVAVR
jgi:hypothetical protein